MALSDTLTRYVLGVVLCGAVAVGTSLAHVDRTAWTASGAVVAGLLVVGIVVGECLPARIWRGDEFREYTFSGPFTIALVVVGPLWLVLLTQTCALLVAEVRDRRPPIKALFNISQYAVAVVVASAAYAALTGQPFGSAHTGPFTTDQLLPSLAAAAVYFLVNAVLVAVVIALADQQRLARSVVTHVRDEISMTTMLLCLAPVVVLSLQFSPLTAPLCLLPVAAVRQAARTAARSHVQAMHDQLTGLPNRGMLMLRSRRVADEADGGEQTALLMLDLDHFKEINDTLGHPVGDELLRLVAARLLSVVGEEDTVARFGGDEFAVLSHGCGVEAAEQLSQRCHDALSEPFQLAQISLHIGVSIGIALLPLHADGIDQLVQRADIALYQAKADRGATRTYDAERDVNTVARLALMEELRRTMDTQLVLHYQPKCRAADGVMVGVEALVRWQHPVRGLIGPADFLPAAENAGLVVAMTMQILRRSLRQVRQWRAQGLQVNVAVNMSPRHLSDVQLPEQIRALLQAEGLPGTALTLEVTENSMLSDPARAALVLRRIRDLGVDVSIDDFGTGYSSLAYLRDLSATEVKIDRTFVSNARTSGRDLAIVRAAVELGHSLGLQVVAEGVEDATTAALMVESGCDLLQGHLLLPASPPDDVLAWSRGPQRRGRDLPPTRADRPADREPVTR
ncbi:putative bifunctional diguanylate cyclase/phosphodiesterase [Aquipuribacter sp. MA13-6]|uniref:putative bifunctional diguanylate cyclase/phosphodiesterase n=1 Tax=unclassified Aquipuribacter TaxID=2635084 RepID=UPI003EEB00C0